MRYVVKQTAPEFFTTDTENLTKWDDYRQGKKHLRQFILAHEQNFLCIYCESQINADNSHIEHIKPKAQSRYPELTVTIQPIKKMFPSVSGYLREMIVFW